jgi:hypothetical protein|tara:strand:- start:309 stop:476 length:168 start_codon:yes stop_codon:yes gene_type:complete
MAKYLIEFTWGNNNPIHEELEVETDDIKWTCDQIARNRGNIQFTKIYNYDQDSEK